MKEGHLELHRSLSQSHQKFVYYVIALAVAAIGFSVHQTSGESLALIHIPLGCATILWGVSVYSGFRSLVHTTSLIKDNITYFEVQMGVDPIAGNHPEKMEYAEKILMRVMKKTIENVDSYGRTQKCSFYLGVVCFLAWHILAMALN